MGGGWSACWDGAGGAARWLADKGRKFSPLVMQGGIIALDGLFLLGKVTTALPARVTQGALVALSSVGVLSVPYNADFLWKLCRDTLCGLRSKNYLVALMASAKALETFGNMTLVGGGLVASGEGLCGRQEQEGDLYEAMVPVGEGLLALTVLLEVCYFVATRHALGSLREGRYHSAEQLLRAMDDGGAADDAQRAALLRACMDKDTLRQLLRDRQDIVDNATQPAAQAEALLAIVADNLDTELKYKQGGSLLLLGAGYGAMALEKYFTPNSVEAAAINLGMALANGGVLLRETLKEVRQRQAISQLALNADEAAPDRELDALPMDEL